MTPDRIEFEKLYPAGAGPVAVPAGLTDRITAAAVRDYRVRRTIRRASWSAGTVAILVAGWFAIPSANREVDRPVARVIDPFREADTALASLSRSAADHVTSATPSITAPAELIPTAVPVPAPPTLSDLPDSARTALEPVTDTTTRAVDRFLKDLGSVAGTRPGL
jgi:hypothetical protein